MRAQVAGIAKSVYKVIEERARKFGLYTYELRYGSKAWMVFYGDAATHSEDTVWKELLVYLMTTKDSNGVLNHIRSIEPLPFDPADIKDHLEIFQADSSKSQIMDETEARYDDVEDKEDRLLMLSLIANPNVHFPEDDEDIDEDDGFDPPDDQEEKPRH
jgi:hypothetical protein